MPWAWWSFGEKTFQIFSVIAGPRYELARKRACWDWTPVHEEALKLLIFEAGVYRSLGLTHPTDPRPYRWGFCDSCAIHMYVARWA